MPTAGAIRFEWDKGWELTVNNMCEGHIKLTTATVHQQVIANAPVNSGDYAASIWSAVRKIVSVWTGYVGSSDPARHLVEFGGAYNPTYAPFRRAVSGCGLRLER